MCVIEQPNEQDDLLELVGVPDNQCESQSRPVAVESCELDCAQSIHDEINAYWIAEEWSNVLIDFPYLLFQIKVFIY